MGQRGGLDKSRTRRLSAFLLTDIEGSTQLWQEHRAAMREAIARHDQLLNEFVSRHAGRVLKERGEGDSVFALFSRVTDAVAAAADIQEAVASENWPEGIDLKIRIAINVGEADADYRGTAVNRTARIRAIAHGGEVLLSQSAATVAVDELPGHLVLCDIGFHHLRDIRSPEHIFQLSVRGSGLEAHDTVSTVRTAGGTTTHSDLVDRLAADAPPTHYAKAGQSVHIAYQVFGNGPGDLVFVPPFVSNVEVWWELPIATGFFKRLATFARVILLDKRGTGLSDRLSTVESPEERIDDIRGVMDAVGSSRAAIVGASEAAPIAIMFAATYPQRTTALCLWGGMARWSPAPDYPWSLTDEMCTQIVELSSSQWGTGFSAPLLYPSGADRPGIREWFAHYERVAASPGGWATILLNNQALDVRSILGSIQSRTLVMHAKDDIFVDVGGSRYLASHIPNAKYVELTGKDHFFCGENGDLLVDEIQEFLTGTRHVEQPTRVLLTILLIRVVSGSGGNVQRLLHIARQEFEQYNGAELEAGRDIVASFDGPGRAIYAAQSVVRAAKRLGLRVKAAVHTGECDLLAGIPRGSGIEIAAAVADQAPADEVTVTGVVRDLVAGSGILFDGAGTLRVPQSGLTMNLLRVRDADRVETGTSPHAAFQSAVERATGLQPISAIEPLTGRQTQVAGLLAAGFSNPQVAARLLLPQGTADWEVKQVLAKLAVTDRTQVAQWLDARGLSEAPTKPPIGNRA